MKNGAKFAALAGGTLGLAVAGIAGCGTGSETTASSQNGAASVTVSSPIQVVAAENEYGNVISQIGGKYVHVTSIMSDPNTDPHTYEASPQTAKAIASAQLVVQNGVGYDDFMGKLESASPNAKRKVIDVQTVLGLPNNTPNPHLWYKPTTMPQVAKAIVKDLSALDPAQASYFTKNEKTFDQSLQPWYKELALVKKEFPNAPVATTEPVADYMLQAAGTKNMTPWAFQAAVMNGTDPAPQDVTLQENLFKQHKVKVFLYNQQVVDTMTTSLLNLAKQNHIPVVGVYETMPTGYTYQSWMLDEVKDLEKALKNHVSTERLS
ncbi:metal ABC transporter solute-binding protein, Zn/Mn family [Alicyclobacillus acidiphilus]|uniref:metal ABC transporter solute-binding protein, Zn/Mn family n=1 Tax=Alicyclobacillus acidiphilus TaxID=182455 RepID=UPI000AE899E6|nr:zinc ABC transporter substrate-binding protein [Alicyclobacillus acidiphilus]